jgi:hypothetical protein
VALLATSFLFTTSARASADSSEVRERSLYTFSQYQRATTTWKKVKITVTPPTSYWDKVAQCETASDWKNGGQWAGGLGIYTKGKFGTSSMGTWEYYGGEEFAPSPDKATKEEQITVANRIAVFGYKTTVNRDPDWAKRNGVPATYIFHKKPVGFSGWGCVKSKSTGKWRIGLPKNWTKHVYVKLPTNPAMYCPDWEPLFKDYQLPSKLFSYIAWRESRCKPEAVNAIWENGQIVWTLNKDGSYDSGLLQINSTWKTVTSQICKASYGDLTILQNPHCNVKVAKYLYDSSHGKDKFTNWRIKVYTR